MNRGFIKISDKLYKEAWPEMHVFMKDFRPTHIEFRHWENDIWYIYGVSDKFDALSEGEPIPQYDVMFTYQQDETLSWEFVKLPDNAIKIEYKNALPSVEEFEKAIDTDNEPWGQEFTKGWIAAAKWANKVK